MLKRSFSVLTAASALGIAAMCTALAQGTEPMPVQPQPVPAEQQAVDPPTMSVDSVLVKDAAYNRKVLAFINGERKAARVKPVRLDADLTAAAELLVLQVASTPQMYLYPSDAGKVANAMTRNRRGFVHYQLIWERGIEKDGKPIDPGVFVARTKSTQWLVTAENNSRRIVRGNPYTRKGWSGVGVAQARRADGEYFTVAVLGAD